MAKRAPKIEYRPWQFKGNDFISGMEDNYEGFVYLITMPDGKKYIGKKFFNSMRKQAGKKRRSKVSSDQERYFSSSDKIKTFVKENGPEGIEREILALCTLKRDVNFLEVYYQIKLGVLEELDSSGNRIQLNDNINGKQQPHLVMGQRDRTEIKDGII